MCARRGEGGREGRILHFAAAAHRHSESAFDLLLLMPLLFLLQTDGDGRASFLLSFLP